MAAPESILGLGLAIAGTGFVGGITILKLWAGRAINGSVSVKQCNNRHIAQDALFASRLETFEQKIVNIEDKVGFVKEATEQILVIIESRKGKG